MKKVLHTESNAGAHNTKYKSERTYPQAQHPDPERYGLTRERTTEPQALINTNRMATINSTNLHGNTALTRAVQYMLSQ